MPLPAHTIEPLKAFRVRSLRWSDFVCRWAIVQEGLTNVLKHAQADHVQVRLRYDEDALAIEVRDDGRGARTGEGLGHGLIGIPERANLYGDDMSAGRGPDGGFVLTSRLPIENVSA